MAISKDRFRKALNDSYTREELFRIFKRYFLDWIAEGYIGSNLGLFEISLISETTNKQTFLDLMEQMYSKEEVFRKIFETLDSEVRAIFTKIAWEGKVKIENREKYLKDSEGYMNHSEVKDEFLFFKKEGDSKKGEYLTLNNDIVRVMRKYLDKPEDYYIHEEDEIEYEYRDNNEERIQKNLSKYYMFYKEDNIKLSASQKILKESKSNMKKYCNIAEYYSDIKDLDFLKTETMGLFVFLMKKEYLNDEFMRAENLKNIIRGFLNGSTIKSEDNTYISLYLNYLKGIKNIEKTNERVKRGLGTIWKILNEFPKKGYVSIENIIKSIEYRDEFIEIIDVESAYTTLYINEANYERTRIVGYENYLKYIVEPFIKSVFFILSALGALEIFYDKPSSANSLYLKNGYLNKYDGIKYVRLTELGKYVLDRKKDYDFSKNLEDEGKVILDNTRLIVTLLGETPIKTMILEKMGIRISEKAFLISEKSFYKSIENEKELEEKIEIFKEKISSNLPENWKKFFETLKKGEEMIVSKSDYKVFKLKDEKELLNVFRTDKRINDLVLKGENLHIMVKEEDIEKLKELLKEHGFFINF